MTSQVNEKIIFIRTLLMLFHCYVRVRTGCGVAMVQFAVKYSYFYDFTWLSLATQC